MLTRLRVMTLYEVRRNTGFVTEKINKLLPWQGNSPDINPIENMWELTKRVVAKEELQPSGSQWKLLLKIGITKPNTISIQICILQ